MRCIDSCSVFFAVLRCGIWWRVRSHPVRIVLGVNCFEKRQGPDIASAELQRSWSQYAQTRDGYRSTVLASFQEVQDGLSLPSSQ